MPDLSFLPYPFVDSYAMFFIYSFVGWICEVIYYGVTEGRFINRGFLNGPICPVYGIGFYGVIFGFMPLMHSIPLLFVGSALVCTAVELACGLILYSIFHLRWWDYSSYRFNFRGFICVRFSLYWGILCSAGMYVLRPAVNYLIGALNPTVKGVTLMILTVILAVDTIFSILTVFRVNQRLTFISIITGGIRRASDKIGSGIYDTVETIVSKTTPAIDYTKENIAEFRNMYNEHRLQEKELAVYHPEQLIEAASNNRIEERKLIASYFGTGRDNIIRVTTAAGRKLTALAGRFKPDEIRLISRIKTSKHDYNNEVIQYVIDNYLDALEREIEDNRNREGLSDYEDTGVL